MMDRKLFILAILVLGLAPAALAASPADDSYRQGEARRLNLIGQQLDLNYRMNWPIGVVASWADPFEPWPFVPGDIWGYPSPPPAEQPIGHRSEQVGPNRWTYRPVYAGELVRPAIVAPRVRPPAEPTIAPPRPSDATEA